MCLFEGQGRIEKVQDPKVMCGSGYNPDPDPKHLVSTVADLTRPGHNVGD
jgi:hypothetical protein